MKSSVYRGRDGQLRLWYERKDVEWMIEDELRRAELFPTVEKPVVDVERFIDRHLRARLDQYADLKAEVLGQTQFYLDDVPLIQINRDLTGAAMDQDDSPQGLRGRWRATLAHEASHVMMHRILFERLPGQHDLFEEMHNPATTQGLMRCLKANVLFRGGGSDWREVQANMGMASLLMPESFFRPLVNELMERFGLTFRDWEAGSGVARRFISEIARVVEVSMQAVAIRLETLGLASQAGQTFLMG